MAAAARGHCRCSRCQQLVEILQRVAGPHGMQPMRMQQLLNVLQKKSSATHVWHPICAPNQHDHAMGETR